MGGWGVWAVFVLLIFDCPAKCTFFCCGFVALSRWSPQNKKHEKYEYKTPLGCNRGLEALLILYTNKRTMC